MDDRLKQLGIVAGMGVAAGAGLALGLGLRLLAKGLVVGAGAGVLLGVIAALRSRNDDTPLAETSYPVLH